MKGKYILSTLLLAAGFATALAQVKTGIEILRDSHFKQLAGKKVGLVTNPTGVDRKLKSTIDVLFEAPEVNLAALFAPEHGIRGDVTAGDEIGDATDPRTGLPVYSLYGQHRKPSPDMLKGLDALVYDIQDIGSRSYTYISTMGLVMEAAAENNVEVIILDRPNPLGGYRFEGTPNIEPHLVSFVSRFPVTYVHGFTVGELATFLNEEQLLSNGIKCRLTVVKMKGWKRKMTFADTGLPWVITSPHIPHPQAASYYAMSGILGELYTFNTGIGYTLPFELFAARWIDAEKLAASMNSLQLDGVIFRPIHFKPYYGGQKDTLQHGIQAHITNDKTVPLTLIQFYVMQECYKLYPDKNPFEMCDRARWSMFDKVCGTSLVRETFSRTFTVDSILEVWNRDVETFRKKASRYFIY